MKEIHGALVVALLLLSQITLGEALGMNFTAIDFETANSKRASVCAVGMAKVRNGQITEKISWLIKPPAGFDHFDDRNIAIHGIKGSDVENAVSWVESAAHIREFIGDDIVVAHYAPFDKSVWQQASEWSGINFGDFHWFCSRDLAKSHLALQDCSLPKVADELGIVGLNHHNAESDAMVCAEIVLAIAKRAGVASWVDLETVTPSKSVLSKSGRPYLTESSIKKSDLPEPNLEADPTHELFDQDVTFTGGFELLGRMEAFELAASFGARIQLGTTRKTSILVICGVNPHDPKFDLSQGSTKAKKAHQYITERGQQIRIMSETEFYVAVGMAPISLLQLKRDQNDSSEFISTLKTVDPIPSVNDNHFESNNTETSSGNEFKSTQDSKAPFNSATDDEESAIEDAARHFKRREEPTKFATSPDVPRSNTPKTNRLGYIALLLLAWTLAIATVFFLICTAAGYSFDAVAGTTFLVFSILTAVGSFYAFRAARRRAISAKRSQ